MLWYWTDGNVLKSADGNDGKLVNLNLKQVNFMLCKLYLNKGFLFLFFKEGALGIQRFPLVLS